MAGLLKQIQRKLPETEAESPILIDASAVIAQPEILPQPAFPHAPNVAQKTILMDRDVIEAEQLLSDLQGESKTALPLPQPPAISDEPPEPAAAVVVRRHAPKETNKKFGREDTVPSYSKQERKLSQQVEQMINLASKRLIAEIDRKLLLDGALEAVVKKAVNQAALDSGEARANWKEHEVAEKELLFLCSGNGPLQPLFDDVICSEIFIDGHKNIKAVRRGRNIDTPLNFRTAEELALFAHCLALRAGGEFGVSQPIVEGFLEDAQGTRVSMIHASIAGADEPRISLRIPRQQKISFYDLLQMKVLPANAAAWLSEVVAQGEANLLIVGPKGSGKTLLTSALLSEIGSDQRVSLVESVPEILCTGGNVEKLVARSSSYGKNLNCSELLEFAIRRGSKRVVVADVLGEECRGFLNAVESGMSGSLAGIYGEFPEDGLWRFLDLLSPHERAPQQSLLRRISRSLHIIISMRIVDGKPCLSEIAECYPTKGSDFVVQPLVAFQGVDDGKRFWKILVESSYWLERVGEQGVSLRSGPGLLPFEKGNSERN